MSHERERNRRGGRLLAWSLLGAAVCGCQTLPPALVPCPLPSVEQASRIQEIVPIGTPREQAVAELKRAGIEGNFSAGNSIFYCDTWTQNDKERWYLNVEVLFDESGKIYAYRPDPKQFAARRRDEPDDAGKASVTKPPERVAEGPKPSVVDPFAE